MNQTQSVSPKVSVIIPVWNPGQGISRCVDSLRNQTLEDIEMIFVDDCGTDGAMDVVRAAAVEDSRIRIITNPYNLGEGASRNVAIEAARGEYIAFVDSDDYIDPDFLEILYKKGKTDNLDIVKGHFILECEDGTIVKPTSNLNDVVLNGLAHEEPLFFLFHYEFQSALFHHRLFVNSNVRFSLTTVGADTTLLLKICHVAKTIDIAENTGYHYLFRVSSASNSFSEASLEARVSALRDKAEYLYTYVEPNPYAVQYFISKLKYYLSLQRLLAKVGQKKEAEQFLAGLRKIATEYPNIEKVDDMSILAFVEYGDCLAERPYSSPWNTPTADDYLGIVRDWVDFLIAHPKHYKHLPKVFKRAKHFEAKMKKEGTSSEEMDWFKSQVRKLWSRPSVLMMRMVLRI